MLSKILKWGVLPQCHMYSILAYDSAHTHFFMRFT